MSRNRMIAVLMALAFFIAAYPVHAQTVYPIYDPIRLSVGARVYHEWDELSGLAGQYSHDWRVGIPVAWELTSPNDPTVKFPVSLTGALDYGVPSKRVRLQAGLTFLLKKAGK